MPQVKGKPSAHLALITREEEVRFVHEYIKDYNGSAAYLRAFPETANRRSSAVYAHHLLKRPHVLAMVKKQSEGRIKLMDITANRVMMEIARIAFSDVRQAVTKVSFPTDDGGEFTTQLPKPITDIDEDTARAVQEVEFTKDGAKLKMQPKMPALALLARMTGALPSERRYMDKPPTELPTYDDDQLGEDELAALLYEVETAGDSDLIDMDDDGEAIIDESDD